MENTCMSGDSKEEFLELVCTKSKRICGQGVQLCFEEGTMTCIARIHHLFEEKEFGKSLVFQLLVLVDVGGEKQKAWRRGLRQYNCCFSASKHHP